MLKRAKAEAGAKQGGGENAAPKAVLESSRQIWLAGLGAFAKAQQGGKQVFDMLVRQGEVLETKTRSAAAQTADVTKEAAKTMAKEMQAMAGGTWDKLEQAFEDRVARALTRVGVNTSSDVQKLSDRVNELSEAVNALLKAQGVTRKPGTPPAGKRIERAVKGATGSAAKPVSKAKGTVANTGSSATKTTKKPSKAASKIVNTAGG